MSKDLQIELDAKYTARLRSLGMNWSAQAQKPFKLRPSSFTSTIEGLKPKTFNQATQTKCIQRFLDDPTGAGIFGISSLPHDGQAKLMAAYMMEHHLKSAPNARPVWHDLTGGFGSSLMGEEPTRCSMLILNNVGPDATQIKKEKLRDVLERYSDLPIVVVVNGSDAFTFMTRDLRKPLMGVLHLTGSLVKKVHEV